VLDARGALATHAICDGEAAPARARSAVMLMYTKGVYECERGAARRVAVG
jgi:hypothetical protein